MPSINSLIDSLQNDFPSLTFQASTTFSWSPTKQTVLYDPKAPRAETLVIHELSHGVLKHASYQRDVELLTIESAAWVKAKELASNYGVRIDDSVIEDHMETYRDWLHARSTCPRCSANGFQINTNTYECPACTHRWRVNEARICALRRYSTSSSQ